MKIMLVGALGRMGANVIAAAVNGGHECRALVDIGYESSTTCADGEFAHIEDAAPIANEIDVIIDFSHHSSAKSIAEFAAAHHIPAVIATTGHTDEEKTYIAAAAKSAPIFTSGNMSLGIASLRDAVKRVLSVFPDADVEIVETHHNRKLDAPSGTALMLFDTVKESRPDAKAVFGRGPGSGKREKNDVGISAVRMGNIVGIHEVIISTDTESITLRHQAYDRALFADGAIKAAEFLAVQAPGLYSMNDIFGG